MAHGDDAVITDTCYDHTHLRHILEADQLTSFERFHKFVADHPRDFRTIQKTLSKTVTLTQQKQPFSCKVNEKHQRIIMHHVLAQSKYRHGRERSALELTGRNLLTLL